MMRLKGVSMSTDSTTCKSGLETTDHSHFGAQAGTQPPLPVAGGTISWDPSCDTRGGDKAKCIGVLDGC